MAAKSRRPAGRPQLRPPAQPPPQPGAGSAGPRAPAYPHSGGPGRGSPAHQAFLHPGPSPVADPSPRAEGPRRSHGLLQPGPCSAGTQQQPWAAAAAAAAACKGAAWSARVLCGFLDAYVCEHAGGKIPPLPRACACACVRVRSCCVPTCMRAVRCGVPCALSGLFQGIASGNASRVCWSCEERAWMHTCVQHVGCVQAARRDLLVPLKAMMPRAPVGAAAAPSCGPAIWVPQLISSVQFDSSVLSVTPRIHARLPSLGLIPHV